MQVDPLSLLPLHIEMYFKEQKISDATGFIYQKNTLSYLITNWHVLSGRDPDTEKPKSPTAAIPDRVRIWHHSKIRLGEWIGKEEVLYDAGNKPKWKQHPLGRAVDVAALPIQSTNDISIYSLDPNLAKTDLLISPSEPVSIIGFPRGIAALGKFPIWKTGHVASDLDLDCDNKPIFVIDTTTKPGMSGSPVIARRIGIVRTSAGFQLFAGEAARFLGIYSGRIDDDTEGHSDNYNLGLVWKSNVLDEILY